MVMLSASHAKTGRKGSEIVIERISEPRLGRPSRRTAELGLAFGLPLYGERTTIVPRTAVPLERGQIVLISGPSGCGKSTALAEIQRLFPGGCDVGRVSFPADTAIVDRIASGAPLGEAIRMLSGCGLGEANLWVRCFGELSEGEKFRARLARAVSLHSRSGGAAPLLCDEFCSTLHRRAAKAIAFNLRKIATRDRLCIVLASTQDDFISDLQPDVVVRFRGRGECQVEQRKVRRRSTSNLVRCLRIERGCKRDYDAFESMHYKTTDELGFVDKVFVLRGRSEEKPVGIVVYSHSPLELSLRNKATDRWFTRNPKRVNRHLRILRRLVIHPDFRGCGIGRYLVQKTLPMVGTRFVECLAAMGEFNPIFERAGMTRIGQYELSRDRTDAVQTLRSMDVDPHSRAFAMIVARRPRVREVVANLVRRWYAGTTAGGEARVCRQSPQFLAQTFRGLIGTKPVYYLWRKDAST